MGFYVVGLGPIGTLLAYHLRAALPSTQTITLIHKSYSRAWTTQRRTGGALAVEAHGVVRKLDGFQVEVFDKTDTPSLSTTFNPTLTPAQTPVYTPPAHHVHTAPISSLFVTTKAIYTADVLTRLLPRLDARSTVVLLHNGMGIIEDLVQRVFRNPATRPHFILASNTHGAWLKDTGHVVHAGHGALQFAIVPDPRGRRDFEAILADDSVPRYARQLSLDDITPPGDGDSEENPYCGLRNTVAALASLDALQAKWSPIADVHLAMRKKLVVNAVVNPLTALLGCHNGALFREAGSRNVMQAVCEEASAVFRAQLEHEAESWLDSLGSGVDKNLVPLGRMPPDLEVENLIQEVKRVADLTKGNISSMLADIKLGRPTEIPYINGYLVNMGKTCGVPTPVNATLCNMIRMRTAIPLDQKL